MRDDPFVGDGEVAGLCREIEWTTTPLGPTEAWSDALRVAVRMCLESPFPINLWCGPELVLIYNDAYRAVLGDKHPAALGRPGPEVWAEIWDSIEPMFAQIRAGGAAIYADDAPFVVRREGEDMAGATEPNAWFTFALSPVRDDEGEIVAMLNVVSETTGRVLAERRIRMERANAERARASLNEVFTHAPAFMALLRGPNHVFEYVNSSYYQLTGHRELIGRPVVEALPEIEGQGFDQLLDEVLDTGVPYVGREIAVKLSRSPGSSPELRYLDFVYYPLTEADGRRTGVVAHGSDVTDHVLSRREAQRARQEAEEANRAKSQFLANMSHEVRTPINAIMGYTDLLELGIAGALNDEQRKQLERVRASSRHLLGIVEDILDVAKVESGSMQVGRERVQATRTADAAVALVEPQAAERGHVIVDGCSGADATYVGDEDRVRQILVNLLSNAVKFTDAGGTIRISCGTIEAPVRLDLPTDGPVTFLRVKDTGIGIAAEEIDRIFRPFTQVEVGNTRTRGGAGLGLTISRHLARLMGGDLTVESTPGEGSEFTLWLPADTVSIDDAIDETREAAPANVGAAGRALQRQVPALLRRYVDRLRGDPGTAAAAGVSDADLEDHAATLLTDVAQSLVALENSETVPDRLLQDGGEIQRVVAELHGRQRARLGWSADALAREWAILREEVTGAVKAGATRDSESAVALIERFMDRAERLSQRSLRSTAAFR